MGTLMMKNGNCGMWGVIYMFLIESRKNPKFKFVVLSDWPKKSLILCHMIAHCYVHQLDYDPKQTTGHSFFDCNKVSINQNKIWLKIVTELLEPRKISELWTYLLFIIDLGNLFFSSFFPQSLKFLCYYSKRLLYPHWIVAIKVLIILTIWNIQSWLNM